MAASTNGGFEQHAPLSVEKALRILRRQSTQFFALLHCEIERMSETSNACLKIDKHTLSLLEAAFEPRVDTMSPAARIKELDECLKEVATGMQIWNEVRHFLADGGDVRTAMEVFIENYDIIAASRARLRADLILDGATFEEKCSSMQGQASGVKLADRPRGKVRWHGHAFIPRDYLRVMLEVFKESGELPALPLERFRKANERASDWGDRQNRLPPLPSRDTCCQEERRTEAAFQTR